MVKLRSVSRVLGLAPEEAAAHWMVRHDRGDLADTEELEFQAWCESPANASAYEKAHGAWSIFDGTDNDLHLSAIRQSALLVPPAPRRIRWWGGAFATLAACAAAFLVFVAQPASRDHGPSFSPVASLDGSVTREMNETVVATAKGERKVLKLQDGSTVTLNTDSAIAIDFDADVRRVQLQRGQALFVVAKDPKRRFIVRAADRQITAIGTKFDVRLDPGRMRLLLVEGKVVVERASVASSSGPASATILKSGQELTAELGAAQQIRTADVANRLHWLDGYVAFDDEPLGKVVAELNRYSDHPVILDDEAVASLRLSGVFRTGDPKRFGAIVSELLPVTIRPAPSGSFEIVARQE